MRAPLLSNRHWAHLVVARLTCVLAVLLALMAVDSVALAQPAAHDETRAEAVDETSRGESDPSAAADEPTGDADAEPAAESDAVDDVTPERDVETVDASPRSDPDPSDETEDEGDRGTFGDEEDEDDAADDMALATPRYVLDGVDVEGLGRTRTREVRRIVDLEPGTILDPTDDLLLRVEWRLRRTGWFDEVSLRLRRGDSRGHVRLVVTVRERNTIVVRDLRVGIAEGLEGNRDRSADVLPYVALSMAETNFLGLGLGLGFDTLISRRQQALRLSIFDRHVGESAFGLRGSFLFANTMHFFGNSPMITGICPIDLPECTDELAARNAVVFYNRTGLTLGSTRRLGSSTHLSVDWVGDMILVESRPDAASERRGGITRPIDFSILDGRSFSSALRMVLLHDRRNESGLPRRGTLFRLQADFASPLFGSNYSFVRTAALARGWLPFGERHSLRLGVFAGAVVGDAPFFYKFQVSDLTDLLPSGAVGSTIDRRAAPNLFGTAIEAMRTEEIAARADIQYEYVLYRRSTRPALRGIHLFGNVGVYMLADPDELRLQSPGYAGASGAPVDLTFDVGLRFQTTFGVFDVGFSNLLWFVDL